MIRTTFNPTHIARNARRGLVAATLTVKTVLIGGALQSPTAAHAAGTRPATTSAVPYLGQVWPSSRSNRWL
jgi:hypothetical protein